MKQGKVWGVTQPIMVTPLVELHKVTANAGTHCSKHMHKHKYNGFYVVKGFLDIVVWKNDYDLVDITRLKEGEFTSVPPCEYHEFRVPNSSTNKTGQVEFLEIYYLTPINPHDIVRENVGGKEEITY